MMIFSCIYSYGLELDSDSSDNGWLMCKTKGSSVGKYMFVYLIEANDKGFSCVM